MSLKQQIDNDIKKAMLARNKEELEALRSIKSLILLAETDKGASDEISADKENKLLVKAAKQRKESADIFNQQNRKDLADKELFQLDVISRYLPKQLSDAEIESALKAIIEQVGAKGPQDLGKVMGVATKSLAGQATLVLVWWRPAVTVMTMSPASAACSAHASGGASPVSTSRTTRSPSMSLPVTSPCADRPSAKRTCVVRSRRLWAFVTTRSGATTNPEPRPWRPMLTTDGSPPPTWSAPPA